MMNRMNCVNKHIDQNINNVPVDVFLARLIKNIDIY